MECLAKNTTPEFVLRPFEGIAGEPDLVALREVVPAATAVARTTAEYGSREITFTTVLPGGWPALHRADGTVFVALQTNAGSGDASRDLAQAALDAFELEPGQSLTATALPGPGPRLQDILDLSVPLEITVQDGFDYWFDWLSKRAAAAGITSRAPTRIAPMTLTAATVISVTRTSPSIMHARCTGTSKPASTPYPVAPTNARAQAQGNHGKQRGHNP